mgnify:CR=1 FL=1
MVDPLFNKIFKSDRFDDVFFIDQDEKFGFHYQNDKTLHFHHQDELTPLRQLYFEARDSMSSITSTLFYNNSEPFFLYCSSLTRR